MSIEQALRSAVELHSAGQFQQAEILCRQVLQVVPNQTLAISILGSQAMLSGKLEQAIELFTSAVRINASDPAHHSNLAQALSAAQRHDEAIQSANRAVTLAPTIAQYWYNLGVALHTAGDGQAVEAYCKTIELNPQHAHALVNLAAAYELLDRPGDAVKTAQRAIEINPNIAGAHGYLALAMAKQGRLDESLAAYRRAVELSPADAALQGQLAYTMLHADIPMQQIYEEHLRWAARHAEPLSQSIVPHPNKPIADRKLRVGYVSPYFVRHAVSYFSEPMITAHNRSQYEVFCYSDAVSQDEVTDRFKQQVDGWRDTARMSDQRLVEMIREDRIDILVDLSGHLPRNRLLVFARKPAPIQIAYLGYQATTGMSPMDYRLTDAFADPPGQTDSFYTEKLLRLPLFFVYRPFEDSPPIGPSPVSKSGHITFGSFNIPVKIGAAVHDAWAKILYAVPDSRLLFLTAGGDTGNEHIRDAYNQRGVGSRVELIPRCSTRDYLDLFNRIDINLDPFPYGGHTTTCDALWMGVPTIVLAGKHYVSRMGVSVMEAIGMANWIADSTLQYIEKIVELANSPAELMRLRIELRPRLQNSPAMNAKRFTQSVEDAYRRVWMEWRKSKAG